ncbi:MAG TPA: peptidoglycan-binding protein, partial [Candidatus Paceibacterota bacterium]|nr:peptidoglycan-binding protein [Candidatus Paceibacterota bacterium]
IHMREVLKAGYIPFTYDQSHQSNDDTVSAEFSCTGDGLNYDNWEWINNPQGGATYNCVAWNVKVPVQNSCPVPDALGDTTKETINNAPDGEANLQTILDNGGYSLDANYDQTNYQVWNVTAGDEVNVDAKYVSKYAGYNSLFGYYTDSNISNFTPIFKTGNVSGYESVPLSNTGPFSITVPSGASTMGFAIRVYGDGNTYETTEDSLNQSGHNQTLVFNPSANDYIVAFEDTLGGDYDYNDLVVKVSLDCSQPENNDQCPAGQHYDANLEECVDNQSCEDTTSVEDSIVSDISTLYNSNPTVALSFIHSAWTASIPGATWIWNEEPLADPVNDTTSVFTKTFNITGTPTGGTLDIAADNSYDVSLNGHEVCSDNTEQNYTAAGQDTCNVPAEDFITGTNTLTFTVKNWAQAGGTQQSNPAGLLYKLTFDQDQCVNTPPPPTSVSVHIAKYVDGVHATAENTDSTSFPMLTTFNGVPQGSASNVPYTLDPNGWYGDPAYEASFSDADPGADYTTWEDTSTSTVGASCDGNHTYALVGYSTSTTSFADAAEQEPTLDAPNFTNLQNDEYVIVWNQTCGGDNGGGDDNPTVDACPDEQTDPGIQESGPCNSDDVCPDVDGIQTDESQCGDTNDTPTCDPETQHLDEDTNQCVDNTPTCDAGEHLNNDNQCVPDNNGNNGGDDNNNGGDHHKTFHVHHGSHSGGGGGFGGQVLGAETSCGIYVDHYLRKGYQNDPATVTKLQQFLDTYENAGIPVTGIFDQATEDALKAFQEKYASLILAPWGETNPTGIFYLTTQTVVNNLMCPTLGLPIPTDLVPFSKNPNTPGH